MPPARTGRRKNYASFGELLNVNALRSTHQTARTGVVKFTDTPNRMKPAPPMKPWKATVLNPLPATSTLARLLFVRFGLEPGHTGLDRDGWLRSDPLDNAQPAIPVDQVDHAAVVLENVVRRDPVRALVYVRTLNRDSYLLISVLIQVS